MASRQGASYNIFQSNGYGDRNRSHRNFDGFISFGTIPAPTPTPTPPLINNIVPSNGSILGTSTPIAFHVTDADPGLVRSYIWLEYLGASQPIMVYDGVDFIGDFATNSTATAITNGFAFSLLPNSGVWSGVVDDVFVSAIDGLGAVADASFGYVAAPPPPVVIQLVRALDARTIEVIFNQRVDQAAAETVSNYSVSPTLTIYSSVKISDFHYRLITSQQVIDQVYTFTAINIGPAL